MITNSGKIPIWYADTWDMKARYLEVKPEHLEGFVLDLKRCILTKGFMMWTQQKGALIFLIDNR
jgi:hypothetical protein